MNCSTIVLPTSGLPVKWSAVQCESSSLKAIVKKIGIRKVISHKCKKKKNKSYEDNTKEGRSYFRTNP